MIRRQDFEKLNEELQETYMESSVTAISEMVGPKLFETKETSLYDYLHQVLHGVSGIKRIADGENFPRVNSKQGDNVTWSQRHYGAEVPVTKDMRKFDRYDQANELVETIVDEAWNDLDQSLADVLIKGWDTSYTDVWGDTVASVGPDGLALFSASHSNNVTSETFSNIINDGTNSNPALSREAIIYQIKTGRINKDVNKKNRGIRYDLLIVPPSLEDLAYRIVESDKIQGSADNDTNNWLKKRVKILVWERLESAADATDAAAYWFMADSRKLVKVLKLLFAEKPTLDPPEILYKNKEWDWTIDFYYTLGFGYPLGIAGSKGDNS